MGTERMDAAALVERVRRLVRANSLPPGVDVRVRASDYEAREIQVCFFDTQDNENIVEQWKAVNLLQSDDLVKSWVEDMVATVTERLGVAK